MKRISLLLLTLLIFAALPVCAQRRAAKKAKTVAVAHVEPLPVQNYLFTFSAGDGGGLQLAVGTDSAHFSSLGHGRTVTTSDYGPWGADKKMYDPYLYRKKDGSWLLAFSVNNHAPCIATAVSDNLLTWVPQDFPKMSVRGCLAPVISCPQTVLFKTKDGEVRKVATPDFHHFSADVKAAEGEYVSNTLTADVDGKQRRGQVWQITPEELQVFVHHFDSLKAEGERNAENMAGDARRFAQLQPLTAKLTVETSRTKAISDKLIGIFFEDISYAADGGLWAELIQNGDFEYSHADKAHARNWGPTYAWEVAQTVKVGTERPLSENNAHYLLTATDTLTNTGWDGIALKKGEKYDFTMYARLVDGKKKKLDVTLTGCGRQTLTLKGTEWTRYALTFTAAGDVEKGTLSLIPRQDKTTMAVDMVSLMPQNTFKGHGIRTDLAETIAALHPKFMRFPGGCMSHGDGIDNIYRWKETVGPWQDRKGAANIWRYHQTRRLGFYEYFQLCEDLGMEPLPVLAAGTPCPNSGANADDYAGQQGGLPMSDMPQYIEDLCDLIEWANGDPATNKWARMRAEAGHPAPFNMKYLGIGNEDLIGTVFQERYLMICKAIKKRYPDIQICGTAGPFHKGSPDYVEGWKVAHENRDVIDLVDEHYYESTGWFLNNQDYYDSYDRRGPKVYLGEYAASTKVRRPTVETALCEAIHLCNIERNGDIVAMTSYAPLLAKDGHHNWNPDMIYFGNTSVRVTPAFETQRLFGSYSGNEYVASRMELAGDVAAQPQDVLRRLVASVVKNTQTGKTYLRLVNALPVQVTLRPEGISLRNGLPCETFAGQPGDQKVTAVRGTTSVTDGSLTLQPYSFTVVEL